MAGIEKISTSITDIVETYKKKIEGGILPPDPARVVCWILSGPAGIEHVVPLPPLIEKIHNEITVPLIESLPRLPMTSDFPFKRWEWWKVEKW